MANVIDKVAGFVVGPQGPQGPQGPKGDTGQTGPQGERGATGATPNLTMGTVTTLESDSQATATITGTAENPVLNLGLPKGRNGEVSQAEFDEVAGDVDALKSIVTAVTGDSDLLDEVAFGGKTYKEIFEGANLIPFGDFENGLGWVTGNTNGAVITNEAYTSKSHSLKCFGTSSVQIRKDILSSATINIDVMCKVKVDRYVSGGGAGFNYSGNHLINRVTDGWETVYYRTSINENSTVSLFFGTVSAANCDAYIDDACIINLSALWNNSSQYPTQAKVKELYDEYIARKNKEYIQEEKSAVNTQLQSPMYIGIVLDANSNEDRFKAMQQLFDIASMKTKDPSADIDDSFYTHASSGAVIPMPVYPCAMYRGYSFNPLYSKNADTQFVPASTTKVMTLVTGLDFVDNINEVVTVKSFDIQSGSGNVFEAGDTVTVKDLMYAMMLPSSNTAAKAFARVCGIKILALRGTSSPTDQQAYDAFIAQMAVKASELGMANSVFDSASGSSANNKMTANDMLKMTVEACTYPDILKTWGAKSYTIEVGGTNPRNVDVETTVTYAPLEAQYRIMGGKTGSVYVDASTSGYALVMVAQAT